MSIVDQTNNGWMINMALGMEMGLGPGHNVLDGDPVPLTKRGWSPQFSAHVYCGQTAGWIEVPLGTELCLGPYDIVLDGNPAPPPQKKAQPPIFGTSTVVKRLYLSGYHLLRR